MKDAREERCAGFVLRLLLDETADARLPEGVGWEDLLRVAARNVVLLRLAERLEAAGARVPDFFAEAVARERRRAADAVETVRRVGHACERKGVRFIFAKAFQHYPDVGTDIDLFVLARSRATDALVLEGTPAAPRRASLHARLAGVSNYKVAGCETLLEIHHGRMGLLGEYGSHVSLLIRNAAPARAAGQEFLSPSDEDVLVMQGMQRVYRHSFIRLCDIVSTATLLRRGRMDWDYVLGTTRRLGTGHGLRCYLGYVEQVHRQVFGRDLLPAWLRAELKTDGCGRVEFREGVYRFPRLRVAGRIYVDKVRAAVRSGNWEGASRLCLLPVLTVAAALRRLGRLAHSSSLQSWTAGFLACCLQLQNNLV
ncbi:MAG TPA: nucleotidyltransferase family protein [Pyrinomonadaceae bacterium]|nr:nucleotidyltransferase family protein [Pyrinomonadaceae bacterium]